MSPRSIFLTAIAVIILMTISCNRRDKNSEVVLEGRVKNLPDGQLFLSDIYHPNVIIDSAVVKGGNFSFHLKVNEEFEPLFAQLYFNRQGRIEPLMFDSDTVLAPNGKPFSTNGFMLERDSIRISGIYNGFSPFPHLKVSPLRISGGLQNRLLFIVKGAEFMLSNSLTLFESQRQLTTSYPESYYLLRLLQEDRNQYSEQEFHDLLSCFKGRITKGKVFTELSFFEKSMKEVSASHLDDIFWSPDGNSSTIRDSSSRLTLIVFWASWCGPCRAEIPEIRNIHAKFSSSRLNIVSVSIDESRTAWLATLKKENMPWKQLWVDSLHIDQVKDRYHIGKIPLMVLMDTHSHIVYSAAGLTDDSSSKKKFIELINDKLTE